MSARLQVRVYENRQPVGADEFDGPVEVGRQRDRDEVLFARKREAVGWRWVVARRDETMIGRNQMRLEPLAGGRVRVINGSDRQPIRFLDGTDLAVGAATDLPLPVVVILSQSKTLRVEASKATEQQVETHSLENFTLPPRTPGPSGTAPRLPSLVTAGGALRAEDVVAWLNSAMDVLQAAASAGDFFDKATRAVVETVSLDAARVLLCEAGTWRPAAAQTNLGLDATALLPPSRSILDKVRRERRTAWELPSVAGRVEESLSGMDVVVAAPILDRAGEVIGALYGERRQKARHGPAFTQLEAQLVELLARGVAAGLARLQEERKTLQMEQFFTQDLARKLVANPALLDGQDREVTVLFADIRGFSRISEALGAAQTIRWCRDVLDVLSASVHDEGGVVVDYVGDGLMAMWGAPDDQPDHAARACRAALDILASLPDLDEKWRGHIQEPLGVGIGINSGPAQVGNVGSRFKFKYGALGNTVNLASRVQGATKFFKSKVLLTGPTRDRLDGAFLTRRLGQVRVVGIAQEVELHELFARDCPFAAEARQEYEAALDLFHAERFSEAARQLGNWRGRCPQDDAVLALMLRSVEALVKGKSPAHPVWELTEK
ncbi:MAG: adenylate/guanylate cyclase domain-containing protein [Gemmataceae bacterium]